jgi:twinkle protein
MTSSINGFEIDQYNIHGLIDGVKYSTCPICSPYRKKKMDKCMSVDWSTGIGRCHHCGARVQLHTYKKKSESEIKRSYIKPTWNNKTDLSTRVVKWFESRGISQGTLKYMQITEGVEYMPQTKKNENTIQFNYFRDNELIMVKYRDGAKHFKMSKDTELIMYNIDSLKINNEAIIVEGEMDALSFIEAGIENVVSIPNGSTIKGVSLVYLDNCFDYFLNKTKIYIGLDTDEAGNNVSKELIRRFGAERCFIIDYSKYKKIKTVGKETEPCKDANEILMNHGDVLLRELLTEAKEVPLTGVSSVMDFENQFEDYLVNGMKRGFVTSMKSFDSIFSTYTGQFITVTGKPSSGKSDFVDSMCIGYNRMYDWKIVYASPENKPNQIHAGKIISKIAGHWVNNKEYFKTEWYQSLKMYIHENFKFIDLENGYDLESVLEKTKELISRFGIKVLVIDPFNKVRLKDKSAKQINEYTSDYLIKIDEFARKYDILIILVAHPTKPQFDKGANYKPDMYSIKGGGEFYDMSPHGILIHRHYEEGLVEVMVLKCKFAHLGENFQSVFFKWNPNNGRYIDYQCNGNDIGSISGELIDDNNYVTDTNTRISNFQVEDRIEMKPSESFEEVPF